MKKTLIASVLLGWLTAMQAGAHCQVPCGIYADEVRITLIEEHITTIEKAMNQIVALSGDASQANQVTRWVMNKDSHADELSEIVTYYFMAQRIKPPKDPAAQEKYVKELSLLHELLVHSMKAKQTTDQAHIKALREKTAAFRTSYLGDKEHTH